MTALRRMHKQSGITLTGMVLGSIVFILLLLLAFKLVPVYTEYYAIQRNFKALAEDPNLKSANRRQVAIAFASRATVDDIRSVRADDIQVTKTGNGIVVSAEYEKRVHLFHNVSACFEFKPSSE